MGNLDFLQKRFITSTTGSNVINILAVINCNIGNFLVSTTLELIITIVECFIRLTTWPIALKLILSQHKCCKITASFDALFEAQSELASANLYHQD